MACITMLFVDSLLVSDGRTEPLNITVSRRSYWSTESIFISSSFTLSLSPFTSHVRCSICLSFSSSASRKDVRFSPNWMVIIFVRTCTSDRDSSLSVPSRRFSLGSTLRSFVAITVSSFVLVFCRVLCVHHLTTCRGGTLAEGHRTLSLLTKPGAVWN